MMTTSRKLSPARPCPFLTDNIIDPTIDCVPEVGVTQKAPMATSGTLCSVQACLFLTHKIIESAVKRVPTEVWQQIFCQMITDRSSFEITEMDRGPWILCKVHPEWDAIASTVPLDAVHSVRRRYHCRRGGMHPSSFDHRHQ